MGMGIGLALLLHDFMSAARVQQGPSKPRTGVLQILGPPSNIPST